MLVRTVATPVCLMSWELDSTFITNRTVKCLSWCVIFLIVNRALASRRPQRATVGLLVSQFFPLCWCFFITCWLGIIWLKLSSYSLHTKKCTVHVCFSKWGLGGGVLEGLSGCPSIKGSSFIFTIFQSMRNAVCISHWTKTYPKHVNSMSLTTLKRRAMESQNDRFHFVCSTFTIKVMSLQGS